MRYDNFFLGVDDLDTAREFYEEKLGLKSKFGLSAKMPPGMLAYNVGNEEPAIFLKDQNIYPNLKPTIWFEVEDVNSEYTALANNGVVFLSEPFEIRTGLAAEFEDPFGNRLGITDYSKIPDLAR